MKEDFLKFLKKRDFEQESDTSFRNGRMLLVLEDGNWEDVSFDVYISKGFNDTYLTAINSPKELKKLLKVLKW